MNSEVEISVFISRRVDCKAIEGHHVEMNKDQQILIVSCCSPIIRLLEKVKKLVTGSLLQKEGEWMCFHILLAPIFNFSPLFLFISNKNQTEE